MGGGGVRGGVVSGAYRGGGFSGAYMERGIIGEGVRGGYRVSGSYRGLMGDIRS